MAAPSEDAHDVGAGEAFTRSAAELADDEIEEIETIDACATPVRGS